MASDAVEVPGPSPPGTLENPLIGKNMTFIFQYDYDSRIKTINAFISREFWWLKETRKEPKKPYCSQI